MKFSLIESAFKLGRDEGFCSRFSKLSTEDKVEFLQSKNEQGETYLLRTCQKILQTQQTPKYSGKERDIQRYKKIGKFLVEQRDQLGLEPMSDDFFALGTTHEYKVYMDEFKPDLKTRYIGNAVHITKKETPVLPQKSLNPVPITSSAKQLQFPFGF